MYIYGIFITSFLIFLFVVFYITPTMAPGFAGSGAIHQSYTAEEQIPAVSMKG